MNYHTSTIVSDFHEARETDETLARRIYEREYARWAKRLEDECNCFVPSGAAEARFSRRMEAQMPALLAAEKRLWLTPIRGEVA